MELAAVPQSKSQPVPLFNAVSVPLKSEPDPVVAPHVIVTVNAPIDNAVFAVGAVTPESGGVAAVRRSIHPVSLQNNGVFDVEL